ncbi:MAG: hypothetical protein ACR2HX_00575 [Pyrinomonadaceae bacterium]|nr:hypothetical protein [Pyrinomonadaceae bacterium]
MYAYRQIGDALEVLCNAPGCGHSYAEIFCDRLLIYDYHYNREHMTVIYPAAVPAS